MRGRRSRVAVRRGGLVEYSGGLVFWGGDGFVGGPAAASEDAGGWGVQRAGTNVLDGRTEGRCVSASFERRCCGVGFCGAGRRRPGGSRSWSLDFELSGAFGRLCVGFSREQLDRSGHVAWSAAGVVRLLRFVGAPGRRDLDGGGVALHSFSTLCASWSDGDGAYLVLGDSFLVVGQLACGIVVVGVSWWVLVYNGVGVSCWSGAELESAIVTRSCCSGFVDRLGFATTKTDGECGRV